MIAADMADGEGGDAQTLSALYPAGTEQKRCLDGVLAQKKGLGF